MKILIAHDGSVCANAIWEDLKSAGLPSQAEVIVLAVYEHWLPLPSDFAEASLYHPADSANGESALMLKVMQAAQLAKSSFPQWQVRAEMAIGSTASIIVQKADEWRPDLVVVGSHNRSALGRLFLGSVSQSVLHLARCSVRVARGRVDEPGTPQRLLIGVDGSKGAEAAVKAVAERHWPRGSEVRLVNGSPADLHAASVSMAIEMGEWLAAEGVRLREAMAAYTRQLQAAGLTVFTVAVNADPKQLLLNEAQTWGADSIFLGARGLNAFARLLLGSVSSSVAARAHCSVEVVRTQ